jgi:hypothetical protein
MTEPGLIDDVVELLQNRYWGKYRGFVHENDDPTGRGRLQVVVPAIFGEQPVWALPCVPYAGPGVGFYALPPKKAGVWVEFEGGHLEHPIWVGCFWGDGEIAERDARPGVLFLRSRHVSIRIDDDGPSLELSVGDASSIRLDLSEIVHKSSTVVAQAGTKRTALNAIHFDVHDGVLTAV